MVPVFEENRAARAGELEQLVLRGGGRDGVKPAAVGAVGRINTVGDFLRKGDVGLGELGRDEEGVASRGGEQGG